jgi:hypothetical protein
MTVTELTDLKTIINWLLENGEFKDTETSYNIAMNAVGMIEKKLSIALVSNSFCPHTMTRNPKEHQENKCRLCKKPYQK